MIWNLVKYAWRSTRKHFGISIINIIGLATGIACCVIVGLYIQDEFSYDKQNKDANRIYRVVENFQSDNGTYIPQATTPPALGSALAKDIPEIESVTRVFPNPGLGGKFFVRYGDKKYLEENVYHVDENFFDFFTLRFISGDPNNALSDPNSVILTASTAKKYFGNVDPSGKTLEIDDWSPVKVTGIIDDVPDNEHFKFQMLIPLRRFLRDDGNLNWGWNSFYTYIKLRQPLKEEDLDKKIEAVSKINQPDSRNNYFTQRLTDIHLRSNLKRELSQNSDLSYIKIVSSIAALILLIASINYINLTTARSSTRAKEIGIRKISGSSTCSLVSQFISESVLVAICAGFLSLAIVESLLPMVNSITTKNLSLVIHGNLFIVFIVISFSIMVGFFAGIYPAFYMSSFEPVKALKGEKFSGPGNLNLRKLLVVAQFTISIILIVGTLIVAEQINFLQNAKLGINKENVIIINDAYYLKSGQVKILNNEWMRIPGVNKVALADGVFGGQIWSNNVRYSGTSSNNISINTITVDSNFFETYNIELIQGKNFALQAPDSIDQVILNEEAVIQLGIAAPLGKKIIWHETPKTKEKIYATIIGVVKDFHFSSMKNEIEPFAFTTNAKRRYNFSIRITGTNTTKIIKSIKNIWEKNVQSRPFQYSFLEERFARLYTAEVTFKQIFSYTTVIAIIISCMGLFGLSVFTLRQRNKEIGIRKIMGASTVRIFFVLAMDFLRPILVAVVIAIPIAWSVMHAWLQNFAYRIGIHWWIFLLAGIIAVFIAISTISFHAVKAAVTNPVKSLRSE